MPAARRDLGLIAGLAVLVWLAIERTETCDRIFAWIAANPDSEADSLVLALVLAALGVAVFAVRRVRELQTAIRARALAEQETHRLAYHDPLTGLPNRRALSERLHEAERFREPIELVLLDLDRFKTVNDIHGHASGDRLLREVATRIQAALDTGQRAFRLGGDEFAVVVPGAIGRRRFADPLAGRLVNALSQPFAEGSLVHHIGASAGIARYPQDAPDSAAILRAADVALYGAKDGGRNRWLGFAPEMDDQIRRRAWLEQEIRGGVAAGEFEPHFQPIVTLVTGEIVGYEVLARWQRADGQQILPDAFIPIADECGLISELTLSILETACLRTRDWRGQPTIHFNLSPTQLRDRWLSEKLLAVLARTGFPPQRIGIEITEDAIIADQENARRVIESLKNLGATIALDDFGTGYSSLHNLRSLPFDRIKIDRSFVRDLDRGANAQAEKIVRGIVSLAHSLDLPVTAEGIESAAVARRLARIGCETGQGYFFGRPQPNQAEPRKRIGVARSGAAAAA